MKAKIMKWIEVLIESINYIVLNYALSNMAMLFRQNGFCILFFASQIWLMGNFWRKIYETTKSKLLSFFFLIVCFVIHIAMVYFIGRVIGDVVPF